MTAKSDGNECVSYSKLKNLFGVLNMKVTFKQILDIYYGIKWSKI